MPKPNIDKVVSGRRDRVTRRWNLDDEIVLIRSGSVLPMAGSDMEHSFHPHPDFAYLTGRGIPDAVLVFDAKEKHWELFGPRSTVDVQVWLQPADPIGLPLEELDGWLKARDGRQIIEANDNTELQNGIGEERLRKDEMELAALRSAAESPFLNPSEDAQRLECAVCEYYWCVSKLQH